MNAVEKKVADLKTSLAEAKKLVTKLEKDLLTAYEDRYPEGRFYVQRTDDNKFVLYWEKGRTRLALTNEPVDPGLYRRPTPPPADMPEGIRVWRGYGRPNARRGYRHETKVTLYKNLKGMMIAGNKFNLPESLVLEFVKRYNAIPKENV